MFHAFMQPTGDLVATAMAAGAFRRLLAAVEAAGLADELKKEGPFTLFAPSDEAFGKVPPEILEAVLGDREKLSAVLKNHVISGRLSSSDLARVPSVQTALGLRLVIAARPGVTINDARMGVSDIEATNGVIHVIDRVLMPN